MNWNGIISLLFACIEFLLLFNLLVFAKKDRMNNMVMLMITLLASYQTMEFLICQFGLQLSFYTYLAFVIISFLPPLNLLLVLTLTRNISLDLKAFSIFIPAIAFSVYYLFVIPKFSVAACTLFYAIYHYPLGDLYGLFYYLPILIAIIELARFITQTNDKDGKAIPKTEKLISKALLLGAIFISLPVLVGFVLMFTGNDFLISAIVSVMCKFAFVYAIILSFVGFYNSPINDERNYFKYLFNNKQR